MNVIKKFKIRKAQQGMFIDTRSDTTRQGYHEGSVPWGAGNGPAGQSPLALIDYTLNYNPKVDEGSQYYDPTYTPPITGIAPSVGFSKKDFLKLVRSNPKFIGVSGVTNPIRNEAELAAARDFAREFNTSYPNGLQIPRGRTPKYYQEIENSMPAPKRFNTRALEAKEDKAMGLTRKTRKKHKVDEAWATGDLRHSESGQHWITNRQRDLAIEEALKNPAFSRDLEKLLLKQAKAKSKGTNTKQINKQLRDFLDEYIDKYGLYKNGGNIIDKFKKGYKIHIKEKNKGKFTSWCDGKVTQECINKGKNSSNPVIRKRATFADNARHFKH